MISRRYMLGILLGAGAATSFLLFRKSYQELLSDTLTRRLSYLKLEPKGVERFAEDFSEHFDKSRLKVASIKFAQVAVELAPSYQSLLHRVREHEDFVLERYLLSSDFFINGADESKEVRYLGYADPYARPCGNPFVKRIS